MGALYLYLFNGWSFTTNNMCHPGGRVVLAWNPGEFQVNPVSCSSQMIHCEIGHEREALWKDICSLAGRIKGPWVLKGDFNCVLNTDERVGSDVRFSELQDFHNCVNRCGLEDVKSSGNFFTWNNKQQGDHRVFCKLDRVMTSQLWQNKYPNTEVCFKNEGYFDHCPGIILMYPQFVVGKKPFKFFPMWQDTPNYRNLIVQAWQEHQQGTKIYQVVQRLKRVRVVLKQLNKEGYGDIEVKEVKASQNLQKIQSELHLNPADVSLDDAEKVAQQEFLVAHSALLSFLSQKSQVKLDQRWR
ncbi:uncharacterized protein [Spinacia oleracea]|uniref:Endonuclease/exonuclease/phosphatase domain-containing protein n=1 Tax=Spinacia oleracea TaxID=3562 RepID=A0ABM3RS67_SPIOL|nr:uncharacterized protein LOC110784796 [Spinacia oleracea]